MTEATGNILGAARQLLCRPVNHLINSIDPPVIVLLYHRVETLPFDPEMLAVAPDNFRAQMRYLKETVPVVRFEEDWATVAKPAVCVTFDDGYADNLLQALPILEEMGVPATFFVSTGTIGTSAEFWWHELEGILLVQHGLPPRFTLDDDRFKKSWPTGSHSERQACYHGLLQLMNSSDAGQRNNWLLQLRRWAQTAEVGSGRHRAMTVDEVRLLAGSSLATIGAHTVSHTRLSCLSPQAQHDEISVSKRQLEAWLGRDIATFSYPFGRKPDYTRQSIDLCRQAGFCKAAANFPGQVHRWTDPYQVPRHLVRNWPLETFAAKLGEFWTR